MGDCLDFVRLELVNGCLLQLDLINKKTQEHHRAFIDPKPFFAALGKEMQRIDDDWNKKIEEENRKLEGKSNESKD
jgi:hypothetical protein